MSAVLLLLLAVSVQGARVDTTWVDSPSMKKKVEVIYVVPDKALGENPQACPVVYLLHGYGGNAGTWIGIKPELGKIADEKGLILLVPTVRTVGIGIVRSMKMYVTRLLSLRN